MSGNDKGIPNWLVFIFFGALLIGGLHTAYVYGFAGVNRDGIRISDAKGLVVAKPAKVARNAAAIAAGEQLAAGCTACHAIGLKGGPIGPDLMDAQWLHGASSEKELFRLISSGILSGMKYGTKTNVMPARGSLANDADVWRVVFYLSSKNPSIKKDAE